MVVPVLLASVFTLTAYGSSPNASSRVNTPTTTDYFTMGGARLHGFFEDLKPNPMYGLSQILSRQHVKQKTTCSQQSSLMAYLDRLFNVPVVRAQGQCTGAYWLSVRGSCSLHGCPASTGFVNDTRPGGTDPCSGFTYPQYACQGCVQQYPGCTVSNCQ
jgi:hypothetical protein